MKKLILVVIVLLVLLTFLFAGCASFDKENNDTSMSYSHNFQVEYNTQTGNTDVVFCVQITNATVYDMIEESFVFSTYKDGAFVKNETINYDIKIHSNKTIYQDLKFSLQGQIDAVQLDSWDCEYSSWWDTYKTYIIWAVIIIAVVVGAIVLFEIFG